MSTQRTAVITGSASGIGAAIRSRLEADGLPGRRHRPEGPGDRRRPLDRRGRSAAVEGALALTDGRIDALVPGAGLGPRSPTGP